ncbi:MAG: hypothetical protein K8S99_17320 [Planctomycetes bacterium]|nr:hypothetical protein [Planctomycetota bacterium]
MPTSTIARIRPIVTILGTVVALFMASSMFSLGGAMPPLSVIVPVIAVTLISLWLIQFTDLMRSPESRFPSRWDKPIWAAVFILLFPIAPIAFWVWKQACENER